MPEPRQGFDLAARQQQAQGHDQALDQQRVGHVLLLRIDLTQQVLHTAQHEQGHQQRAQTQGRGAAAGAQQDPAQHHPGQEEAALLIALHQR